MPQDHLLRWANGRWTAPLVRRLGLPQPRVLPRCTSAYGPREFEGRHVQRVRVPSGAPDSGGLADWLRDQGAQLWPESGRLGVPAPDAQPSPRLQTCIVDARTLIRTALLDELHDALSDAVRQMAPGGRILFLAPAAEESCRAALPEALLCRRALEGFMRSLARELGRRGATANMVCLPQGPLYDAPEQWAPMLRFLGTDRSAYVSGQVLVLQDEADHPFGPAASPWNDTLAVVTGAAGGIGAATVRRLAAEGARVACVDRPEAAPVLDALAHEVRGLALPLDIIQPDAPDILAAALAGHGGIDLMVHNAGITRDRTFARMRADDWHAVMAVNLQAILAIDAALDAATLRKPGAREVCLSSISGLAGNAGQTNYAATKAGLIGHVQQRARIWQSSGRRINAIAPGFIETPMTAHMPWMAREAARRLNALSQGGLPTDVAEAIAFISHPEATTVQGQVLRMCGLSLLGA